MLHKHDQISSLYFYFSLLCYCTALSIFGYLSIYLPYFKNIHEDQWDQYCPNMIPLATVCGLLGMISLIISVWNVWGYLSIPIIIIIKLGFVMTVHYAPGGTLGSIVFVVIIISALISGYYIEHEGYLH